MKQERSIAGQPWHGRWCWTTRNQPLPWNQYVLFRRRVDLPEAPRGALVRISADARYVLFVNGQRVHQGPARSFPEYQSFDTLDLTRYLKAGQNTLCAICHQFGVPTFQSQYRGQSGFLLDGVVLSGGDAIPLHTPAGWVCRRSRAWRQDVGRLSKQMGFQEHYDADADPPDWMDAAFEPREQDGWASPADFGPVGVAPWYEMEDRGVPLLRQQIIAPTGIVAQFTGENARGYKVAQDVYALTAAEKHRKAKDPVDDRDALLRDDPAVTVINPPADGEFVALIVDFGQTRSGQVMLDIAHAAGDEIIDIIYAERLEKDQFPYVLGDEASCVGTADRYRCRPGAQVWETFGLRGLRYAGLIFRNVTKPLTLRRVAMRQVHADLTDVGSFACSDAMLTRIWEAGRVTLRQCMVDAYVDCPWREQAQWWGDARVQFLANAYCFGDLSLLARGIRQVAQSQGPDGTVHAHPPADAPFKRLPDYMMTWVGSIRDHYFHSGSPDVVRQCLPAMHRLMRFFAGHENPDGLIGGFDGWWVFLDWADLHKTDYSAVLNLMYLQSLRWAAELSALAQDAQPARDYAQQADRLAAAIEKHFFDDKQVLWRDGYDAAAGAPVDKVSQHANCLAMLLGLKTDTHERIAREVLLKAARSKRSKVVTASPFFYAYVLDALAGAGLRRECVEIIREKWGAMLDAGATTLWEGWDGKASRCHAWSASPVYHLSQIILGVTPLEAGWKRVRIAPLPCDLEFARGVVPTPHGPIRVEWESAGKDQLAVRVELPPGITGEFVSPLGQTRTLASGAHDLHM